MNIKSDITAHINTGTAKSLLKYLKVIKNKDFFGSIQELQKNLTCN